MYYRNFSGETVFLGGTVIPPEGTVVIETTFTLMGDDIVKAHCHESNEERANMYRGEEKVIGLPPSERGTFWIVTEEVRKAVRREQRYDVVSICSGGIRAW